MWCKLAETNSNPSHTGTEARQPRLKIAPPFRSGLPLFCAERKKDGKRRADGPDYRIAVEYQPLALCPVINPSPLPCLWGRATRSRGYDWVESLPS